jgi:hypothetical protein
MTLADYVERMEAYGNIHRIMVGNAEGRRRFEKREDSENLDWTYLAPYRDQWCDLLDHNNYYGSMQGKLP